MKRRFTNRLFYFCKVVKKTFVLVVLFVLPLVAYLFFASGINNFGRLPILTESVTDISELNPQLTLEDKITILGFPGNDQALLNTAVFNLNQKIYKPFHEFHDFQMVMIVPDGMQQEVDDLKSELATFTDISRWNFLFTDEMGIQQIFNSLETNLELQPGLGTPYVFIIDKERNLRGRRDDSDEGIKFGFNTTSVAELNNKMEDDVKIILAEYRLALRKNNADREK